MNARKLLKQLRLMTGLSIGQMALALGWPKSTYARYEEVFSKHCLPERLAPELLPVLEFFGISRPAVAHLFEPDNEAALVTIPPLVVTLNPKSDPDARRIETLLKIKSKRRTTRRMPFSMVPKHLMDFEAFAILQQDAEGRFLPEVSRRASDPSEAPAEPVLMDVVRAQRLEDGTLQIDFDNPLPDEAPFHLKGLTGLYALFMEGPNALPGHARGDMLLAARMPVKWSDMAIVTYRPENKTIPLCSIVGRVVTLDEQYIQILPLNMPEFRIGRELIQRIDRVLTNLELLGRAKPE